MQEGLTWQLYLGDECDHCKWIEERLHEVEHRVNMDIWDVSGGVATNRATGDTRKVDLRGIPCLQTFEPNVTRYGAKLILEKLGVSRRIFIP